jgi:hypothetical protein
VSDPWRAPSSARSNLDFGNNRYCTDHLIVFDADTFDESLRSPFCIPAPLASSLRLYPGSSARQHLLRAAGRYLAELRFALVFFSAA